MKIFIGDKLIKDIPMNFECIRKSGIVNEESIVMIPYRDIDFLGCAKLLIDDLVATICPSWKYPDYNSFKSYIYIEDGEHRISLEVFPDKMSSEKRNLLLQQANKKIREDGYSDYYEIQDAFDSCDTFYTDENPFGEIWSYHMLPTEEEIRLVAQLDKA